MKYELVKDSQHNKSGFVFDDEVYTWVWLTIPQAIEYWIACKVEEKKKPKFKVGDYVMLNYKVAAIKITTIVPTNGRPIYNGWYTEGSLRTPTKEELELYFR